jgi:hypothetical protein
LKIAAAGTHPYEPGAQQLGLEIGPERLRLIEEECAAVRDPDSKSSSSISAMLATMLSGQERVQSSPIARLAIRLKY